MSSDEGKFTSRPIETPLGQQLGAEWEARNSVMRAIGGFGRILFFLGLAMLFFLCPPTAAIAWHGDMSLWVPALFLTGGFVISTIGVLLGGTIKFD